MEGKLGHALREGGGGISAAGFTSAALVETSKILNGRPFEPFIFDFIIYGGVTAGVLGVIAHVVGKRIERRPNPQT